MVRFKKTLIVQIVILIIAMVFLFMESSYAANKFHLRIPTKINKNRLEEAFEYLVKRLFKEKEYRPVGVAVLYREVGEQIEFLITKPVNNPNIWSFVQGGVEVGETIEDNLSRELEEELAIDFKKDLTNVVQAYYYETLDAEVTREDKRGFTRGKAYFFTLARYVGNRNFVLQKDEAVEAKWVTYEEAVDYFNRTRHGKATLSKIAIGKALEILSKGSISVEWVEEVTKTIDRLREQRQEGNI